MENFRRLIVRALGVLALVLSAAPAHADSTSELAPLSTQLDHPVSLDAQWANGTLLVHATINGAGPFNLLVDTGCSASIISPAVALAVDARTPEEPVYVSAVNSFGATGSIPIAMLDSLDLGGAHFEGVPAGVTSLDLQSKITGLRIDGILGYPVFAELFLTLDFPHHRVGLSSAFPKDLPPVRTEVPLRERNAVPYVPLTIQGREFELMLDSGANGGLELDPDSAKPLAWKIAPRAAGLVAALGGTGRDWIGRLSGSAALGDVVQPEPLLSIGSGSPRIGTAFLRTFAVVFSHTQGKLWLCSASTGPLPSPARRTTGVSLLADTGGWRIVGTIPDSPAAKAGLLPGQLITALENSPATQWTREDIQTWADQHDAVTLEVAGPGLAHRLTLPIWSIVP